jgi:hypothetical protein
MLGHTQLHHLASLTFFFFSFRAGAPDGPSGAVDLFNMLDMLDASIPLLATGADGAVVSGDNASFL